MAVIDLTPQAIEAICDLRFERTQDDLDQILIAVVEIGPRQLALLRYDSNPTSGTTLYVGANNESAESDLRALLAYLGLSEDSISWRSSIVPES